MASEETIRAAALLLDEATSAAAAVDQLSKRPDVEPLDLDDAYAVQLAGIDLRRERGEEVVGLKLGFTSKEKARQMGVSDVIIGVLTSAMTVPSGDRVVMDALIHPRIEPEVAFLLSGEVDDLAAVDLLDHVTHVAPALEIIDSRYRDFSFSLEDVVADNTSAIRYVVGAWQPFDRRDLADLAVEMRIAGEAVAQGSTGAILGDPLNALGDVRRLAARYGHPLPAGSVVLAGAATAAATLPRGVEVVASVAGLGEVSVTTE